MAEEKHVYPLHAHRDVEVEVEGVGYPGELRGCWERDGQRLLNIQWHARRTKTCIDTVPAKRVRQV
jgi:hypothetical protein